MIQDEGTSITRACNFFHTLPTVAAWKLETVLIFCALFSNGQMGLWHK